MKRAEEVSRLHERGTPSHEDGRNCPVSYSHMGRSSTEDKEYMHVSIVILSYDTFCIKIFAAESVVTA